VLQSPAHTQDSGPLIPARLTLSDRYLTMSWGPSATATIAPFASGAIRSPRLQTSVSAASRVKTPARQAATYSPREWPIMAAGRTPFASSDVASAYSTQNSAGWGPAVAARAAVA